MSRTTRGPTACANQYRIPPDGGGSDRESARCRPGPPVGGRNPQGFARDRRASQEVRRGRQGRSAQAPALMWGPGLAPCGPRLAGCSHPPTGSGPETFPAPCRCRTEGPYEERGGAGFLELPQGRVARHRRGGARGGTLLAASLPGRSEGTQAMESTGMADPYGSRPGRWEWVRQDDATGVRQRRSPPRGAGLSPSS